MIEDLKQEAIEKGALSLYLEWVKPYVNEDGLVNPKIGGFWRCVADMGQGRTINLGNGKTEEEALNSAQTHLKDRKVLGWL